MNDKNNLKFKTFGELKDGDLIISPIDHVVTEFRIFDGEYYLCTKNSAYPTFQFDPDDFILYMVEKAIKYIDEKDEGYVKTFY